MTEAEWLACSQPGPLLEHLWGGVTERTYRPFARKYRLFAVACCRRVWPAFPADVIRDAVGVAEEYAEGFAADEKRHDAAQRVRDYWAGMPAGARGSPGWWAVGAAYESLEHGGYRAAITTATACVNACAGPGDGPSDGKRRAEEEAQGHLVREVFGNPFRPLTLTPAWRTSDVLALARAGYEERGLPEGMLEPARLGLLADALEDAGCADAEVLGHLRGPGPHVRGCWAVDLILGKS